MEIERNDLIRCMWCNFKMDIITNNLNVFYAYCDNCGAQGPSERSEDHAVSEWNRIAAQNAKEAGFTSGNKQIMPCDKCGPHGIVDQYWWNYCPKCGNKVSHRTA